MSDEEKKAVKPSPKAAKASKPVGAEMSVREAGKKGGDTVRDRYGSQFYEEIGRKGGQATRERHGADFYEQIGHKGGQKVKKLIADAKKNAADLAAAQEKKPDGE
jgi:general stress protein YciG